MYYNAGILFPQANDYIRISAVHTEQGLSYRLAPIKAFKILNFDLNTFMDKHTTNLERDYYSGVDDNALLEEISYNLTVAFNTYLKEKLHQGQAFLMDFKSNEEVQHVFGENNVVYRGKNYEWALFNPLTVLKSFNSVVKH